ncbi:MAG: hypothetical protein AAGL24_19655 [Pseudomonadota bacterium]
MLNGVEFDYTHSQIPGKPGTIAISILTFPGSDPTTCRGAMGAVYCFPVSGMYVLDQTQQEPPRRIRLMAGGSFEVRRVAPQVFHMRSGQWRSANSQILWEVNTNTRTVREEYYDDPDAEVFGRPYRSPTSTTVLSGAWATGVSPGGFRVSISGGQIFAKVHTENAGPYELELGQTFLRQTIFFERLTKWRLTRPDVHSTEFTLESPLANYRWQIQASPASVTEHFVNLPPLDQFDQDSVDFGTEDVRRLRLGVEYSLPHHTP